MAEAGVKKVEVTFQPERATKRTIRFREIQAVADARLAPEVVGILYVQKWFAQQVSPDGGLRVTIEITEPEV